MEILGTQQDEEAAVEEITRELTSDVIKIKPQNALLPIHVFLYKIIVNENNKNKSAICDRA